ncbi:MAG TPA: hypothetical protein VJA94_13555 [Candidatus Angelobacter sp.]
MKNLVPAFTLVMFALGIASVPLLATKQSRTHMTVQVFEIVDCKTDEDPGLTLRGTEKRYCFAGKAIVDETQIESASVMHSEYDPKPGLRLKFKPEGASRLHETSARVSARDEGPGQFGFVVNGKLVSVAIVRGAFGTDVVISGAFGAEECQHLATMLNAEAQQAKNKHQK